MQQASDSLKLILEDQVEQHLPPINDVILSIESILARFKNENTEVKQPVRTLIHTSEYKSAMYTMPCYLSEEDVFCVKYITYGTTEDGKVQVFCHITLFRGMTGQPLILLEGETLTMKRTAAASAVATKYLVNGVPSILAILGSGRLARSHFEALSSMYNFKQVRIWNRSSVSGMKFVKELRAKKVNTVFCDEASSAVENADVVCVVTGSHEPVLDVDWIKPGAHINAVGACQPTAQEIFPHTINNAVVYVDSKQAALVESGDIIKSRVEIYAEIGEVIRGEKEAFKERKTIFKSLGMAIEDAVTAYSVYKAMKSS